MNQRGLSSKNLVRFMQNERFRNIFNQFPCRNTSMAIIIIIKLKKEKKKIKMMKSKEEQKIFRKLAIIVLLFQISIQLQLNLQQTEIIGSKDQYRIKFKPSFGVPPYILSFPSLPKDWSDATYLFAPRSNSTSYTQDLISVILKDQTKKQVKISVVFISNSQHMFLDTTIYDFNTRPDQLGLVTLPNEENQNEELLSQKIQDIIQSSSKQGNRVLKSNLNDIFKNIPTPLQISNLLNFGKVNKLIELISNLPSTELNCIQQVAYLSEISARSEQAYFAKKKQQDNKENKLLEKLKENQNKRKKKVFINPAKGSSQNKKIVLNLIEQNNKLKLNYFELLQKLKQIYTELLTLNNIFQKKNKQLIQTGIKIDQSKKQVEQKYLSLSWISITIPELSESEQVVYKKYKETILERLKQLNGTIKTLRQNTIQQEEVVNKINIEIDQRQLAVKNTQLLIQRVIQDINQNKLQILKNEQEDSDENENIKNILKEKFNLNLRADSQIDQIVSSFLETSIISDLIEFLNRNTDQIYYRCYGVRNYQSASQLSLYAYQIPYSDFINYFISFYQNGSKEFLINNSKKIDLRRISILSSIWTKQFGQSFSLQVDQNNKIRCNSTNDKTKSNSGIIRSIKKNVIQVRTKRGIRKYINLGPCSRIEVQGKAPQIGNLIFWRGNQISNSIYQGLFVLII